MPSSAHGRFWPGYRQDALALQPRLLCVQIFRETRSGPARTMAYHIILDRIRREVSAAGDTLPLGALRVPAAGTRGHSRAPRTGEGGCHTGPARKMFAGLHPKFAYSLSWRRQFATCRADGHPL